MADLLLSTLRGGGGGGIPLGGMVQLASHAPILDLPGMKLLRTGSVVSASVASVAAAAIPSNQYYEPSAAVTVGASNKVTSIESDGAGTWLMCAPNISASGGLGAGNLRRSTDNGATWSTVNVGGTFTLEVTSVARTSTHWVVVGNNNTNLYVARSASGAAGTWTVTTSLTAFSGATFDVARVGASLVNDGTLFVHAANTTAAFSSTDHGATWTNRTLGSAPAVTAATHLPHPIFVGTQCVVANNTAGNSQRATVGTWTWTQSTETLFSTGASTTRSWDYAFASSGAVCVSSNGKRSTDGAAWAQVLPPEGLAQNVRFSQGKFWTFRGRASNTFVGFVGSSTDGLTWEEVNTSISASAAMVAAFGVGNSTRMLINSSSNQVRAIDLATPMFVGDAFAVGDLTASTPTLSWYRRIA